MDNLLWEAFSDLTAGMIVDVRTAMLGIITLMIIYIAYRKIQIVLNPPDHDAMLEESFHLKGEDGIDGAYHRKRFNTLMNRKVNRDIEGDF